MAAVLQTKQIGFFRAKKYFRKNSSVLIKQEKQKGKQSKKRSCVLVLVKHFFTNMINSIQFCFYLLYIHHTIVTTKATISITATATVVAVIIDADVRCCCCFPMVACYLNYLRVVTVVVCLFKQIMCLFVK